MSTTWNSVNEGNCVIPGAAQLAKPKPGKRKRQSDACYVCHGKKIKCERSGNGSCDYCRKNRTECVIRPRQNRKRKDQDCSSGDETESSITVQRQVQGYNRRASRNQGVHYSHTELAPENVAQALQFYRKHFLPLLPIQDLTMSEKMMLSPTKAVDELDSIELLAIYVVSGPHLGFIAAEVDGLYEGLLCDMSKKIWGDAEIQPSLLRAVQVLMAFAKDKADRLPRLLIEATFRIPDLDDRAKSVCFVLGFSNSAFNSVTRAGPFKSCIESSWCGQMEEAHRRMNKSSFEEHDIWLCSLVSVCQMQREFFKTQHENDTTWSMETEARRRAELQSSLTLLRVQLFPSFPLMAKLNEFLVNLVQASFYESRICLAPFLVITTDSLWKYKEIYDEYVRMCENHVVEAFGQFLELMEKLQQLEEKGEDENSENEWQKISHLRGILHIILPAWLLEKLSINQRPLSGDVILGYMKLVRSPDFNLEHAAFPHSRGKPRSAPGVEKEVAQPTPLPATSVAQSTSSLAHQPATPAAQTSTPSPEPSRTSAQVTASFSPIKHSSAGSQSTRSWPKGLGF